MKYAFLALTLLACADTDEPALLPSVAFVAPEADSTVAAGDVQVSLSVEHFAFQAPTATARFDPTLLLPVSSAWAHGEEDGEAAGYVVLALDGVVVGELTSTQHTLAAVTAGPHRLDAGLYYADGDEVGPTASVTFSAEE